MDLSKLDALASIAELIGAAGAKGDVTRPLVANEQRARPCGPKKEAGESITCDNRLCYGSRGASCRQAISKSYAPSLPFEPKMQACVTISGKVNAVSSGASLGTGSYPSGVVSPGDPSIAALLRLPAKRPFVMVSGDGQEAETASTAAASKRRTVTPAVLPQTNTFRAPAFWVSSSSGVDSADALPDSRPIAPSPHPEATPIVGCGFTATLRTPSVGHTGAVSRRLRHSYRLPSPAPSLASDEPCTSSDCATGVLFGRPVLLRNDAAMGMSAGSHPLPAFPAGRALLLQPQATPPLTVSHPKANAAAAAGLPRAALRASPFTSAAGFTVDTPVTAVLPSFAPTTHASSMSAARMAAAAGAAAAGASPPAPAASAPSGAEPLTGPVASSLSAMTKSPSKGGPDLLEKMRIAQELLMHRDRLSPELVALVVQQLAALCQSASVDDLVERLATGGPGHGDKGPPMAEAALASKGAPETQQVTAGEMQPSAAAPEVVATACLSPSNSGGSSSAGSGGDGRCAGTTAAATTDGGARRVEGGLQRSPQLPGDAAVAGTPPCSSGHADQQPIPVTGTLMGQGRVGWQQGTVQTCASRLPASENELGPVAGSSDAGAVRTEAQLQYCGTAAEALRESLREAEGAAVEASMEPSLSAQPQMQNPQKHKPVQQQQQFLHLGPQDSRQVPAEKGSPSSSSSSSSSRTAATPGGNTAPRPAAATSTASGPAQAQGQAHVKRLATAFAEPAGQGSVAQEQGQADKLRASSFATCCPSLLAPLAKEAVPEGIAAAPLGYFPLPLARQQPQLLCQSAPQQPLIQHRQQQLHSVALSEQQLQQLLRLEPSLCETLRLHTADSMDPNNMAPELLARMASGQLGSVASGQLNSLLSAQLSCIASGQLNGALSGPLGSTASWQLAGMGSARVGYADPQQRKQNALQARCNSKRPPTHQGPLDQVPGDQDNGGDPVHCSSGSQRPAASPADTPPPPIVAAAAGAALRSRAPLKRGPDVECCGDVSAAEDPVQGRQSSPWEDQLHNRNQPHQPRAWDAATTAEATTAALIVAITERARHDSGVHRAAVGDGSGGGGTDKAALEAVLRLVATAATASAHPPRDDLPQPKHQAPGRPVYARRPHPAAPPPAVPCVVQGVSEVDLNLMLRQRLSAELMRQQMAASEVEEADGSGLGVRDTGRSRPVPVAAAHWAGPGGRAFAAPKVVLPEELQRLSAEVSTPASMGGRFVMPPAAMLPAKELQGNFVVNAAVGLRGRDGRGSGRFAPSGARTKVAVSHSDAAYMVSAGLEEAARRTASSKVPAAGR